MPLPDAPGHNVTYIDVGYAKDATRIEQPTFEAIDAQTANASIEGATSSSSGALAIGTGNSSRSTAAGTGSQSLTH